ncbi:MAG: nucleotidyltransferase domain-containing protein [Prolixibacteraceae bacterium]|nr:nucleotidyltransferase domain-containing protein [Prolixibacteraceae bacterium]
MQKESIEKAWLFGSFAKENENDESDIDLVIRFTKDKKITLFYYIRLKNNLEQITGRHIDLVEEGQLKLFAVPDFEKDKILIYER